MITGSNSVTSYRGQRPLGLEVHGGCPHMVELSLAEDLGGLSFSLDIKRRFETWAQGLVGDTLPNEEAFLISTVFRLIFGAIAILLQVVVVLQICRRLLPLYPPQQECHVLLDLLWTSFHEDHGVDLWPLKLGVQNDEEAR